MCKLNNSSCLLKLILIIALCLPLTGCTPPTLAGYWAFPLFSVAFLGYAGFAYIGAPEKLLRWTAVSFTYYLSLFATFFPAPIVVDRFSNFLFPKNVNIKRAGIYQLYLYLIFTLFAFYTTYFLNFMFNNNIFDYLFLSISTLIIANIIIGYYVFVSAFFEDEVVNIRGKISENVRNIMDSSEVFEYIIEKREKIEPLGYFVFLLSPIFVILLNKLGWPAAYSFATLYTIGLLLFSGLCLLIGVVLWFQISENLDEKALNSLSASESIEYGFLLINAKRFILMDRIHTFSIVAIGLYVSFIVFTGVDWRYGFLISFVLLFIILCVFIYIPYFYSLKYIISQIENNLVNTAGYGILEAKRYTAESFSEISSVPYFIQSAFLLTSFPSIFMIFDQLDLLDL